LRFFIGGGGTNTAVSLRRLGLNIAYLGKVGGEGAKRILDLLRKEKIDFVGAQSKEESGYSIILDSKEHNRTVLTYKGVNDDLKFSEVNLRKLKTKWFYFSSMLGESFKTQVRLAKFAKRNNIKICYNPSAYQIRKNKIGTKALIRKVDVLVFNKEEAGLLVGKGNVKNLLKKVYKIGPRIVVITDGRNGSCAYDGHYVYYLKTHDIKVEERTGAGDAFASTFLAGLIKGKDVEFSMRLALINAESVLGCIGAKNELLSWRELLNKFKGDSIRIKKWLD